MSNGQLVYSSSIVLFEKFSLLAHGFHPELVADAGLNIVINAIRQGCPTAPDAANAWAQIMSGAEHHLMSCYDDHGRKKMYAYHQVPRVDER